MFFSVKKCYQTPLLLQLIKTTVLHCKFSGMLCLNIKIKCEKLYINSGYIYIKHTTEIEKREI